MSEFSDHIDGEVERIRDAYAKIMSAHGSGLPVIPSAWRETVAERRQREATERVRESALRRWNILQWRWAGRIPAPRVTVVAR